MFLASAISYPLTQLSSFSLVEEGSWGLAKWQFDQMLRRRNDVAVVYRLSMFHSLFLQLFMEFCFSFAFNELL
jgi:hypothetical protein